MPAREVADEDLYAVLGVGYGINAGREVAWAKLRFTPPPAGPLDLRRDLAR